MADRTASSGGEIRTHLAVIVHGLWGEPKHTRYLARNLARRWDGQLSTDIGEQLPDDPALQGREAKKEAKQKAKGIVTPPDSEEEVELESGLASPKQHTDYKLVVCNTKSNTYVNTYDGVDWCAERVVKEIEAEVKRLLKENHVVKRFSIIGYSLGGLISRYAIGLLLSRGFFDDIEPHNFYTFATPHIGIPPAGSGFGKFAAWVGGKMLSRSGEQLFVQDQDWGTPASGSPDGRTVPLLLSMTLPDSAFIRALNKFEHVQIYANTLMDLSVPYRSAAIEAHDPFIAAGGEERLDAQVDGAYPAILRSFALRPAPPPPSFLARILAPLRRSVPFWLNPRRFPFPFPLNYLAILFLPILLPTFVCMILYNFRKESRRSRGRIAGLRAEWAQRWNDERGEEADPQSVIGDEARTTPLLSSLAHVKTSVEDSVRPDDLVAVRSETPSHAPGKEPSSQVIHAQLGSDARAVLDASPPNTLPPLRDVQLQMVDNFARHVPKLQRVLVWLPETINTHAVIIVRMPAMEMHQRGKPVIRHFVDHFKV